MKEFTYVFFGLIVLILTNSVWGATLHGNIYDLELEPVSDVLVEIDTTPKQQYLAKNGEYSFEVPAGAYILKATKGELVAEEEIRIREREEGEFVFDLFLFPSLEEEEEILSESEGIEVEEEEKKGWARYPLWRYILALAIILILIGRVLLAKKKYKKTRGEEGRGETKKGDKERNEEKDKGGKEKDKERDKTGKEEEEETGKEEEEEEKEEKEPNYLEETLEIIRKHEGRIYQKELRKEMMHLSEAKVSLILTELEHKGKIEKVKRGRGKVILLKEN